MSQRYFATVGLKRGGHVRSLVVPVIPVAGLALAVLLAGCTHSSGSPASPSSVVPAAQVSAVVSALTATEPTSVEPVLAPAVLSAFQKHPFALLPPGSKVVVDTAHITVAGESATVPVVVTGGAAAGKWTLLLEDVDGKWLLYGTQKG